MDRVRELLERVKKSDRARGNLLGLLHILIGRQVTQADGTPVAHGLTWREVAEWLKKVRWKKEAVAELGVQRTQLTPRDRMRYWYQAIALAQVHSGAAVQAAERLAPALAEMGYVVGPPPRPS